MANEDDNQSEYSNNGRDQQKTRMVQNYLNQEALDDEEEDDILRNRKGPNVVGDQGNDDEMSDRE